MKEILDLVRENIRKLTPYSTARDDCKIKMDVYLDANENPYENGVNRYPSPFQQELKQRLAILKGIKSENIFLGNGSDEAIDLVYRIFCEPNKSSTLIISPSYGMYSVAADINAVDIIKYRLEEDFSLDAKKMLSLAREDTRVLFICSPNNPSGNLLSRKEIEYAIDNFNGIVVVDEAYIDFAESSSLSALVTEKKNLVVLQTLSKLYAMAGLRIGIAIADSSIVKIMNSVKYPYNISCINQQMALSLLKEPFKIREQCSMIIEEREYLEERLRVLPIVERVFKSDANFLLVKFIDKSTVFKTLTDNGIIVRDRSSLEGCANSLRITVGTPEENDRMLGILYGLSGTEFSPRGKNSDTERENERRAILSRETSETSIQVALNLDRFSTPFISTGLHFFDHMLEQISYHAAIGLNIVAVGDIERDDHHTVEDVAITLAQAFDKALGSRKGIERYGFSLPMDEAEATVLIDLGGRIDFEWEVEFSNAMIGDVNAQMFNHFFKSFAQNLKCNLHIKAKGENDHHIIEGVFKAFARALKCAIREDRKNAGIPSSKGKI